MPDPNSGPAWNMADLPLAALMSRLHGTMHALNGLADKVEDEVRLVDRESGDDLIRAALVVAPRIQREIMLAFGNLSLDKMTDDAISLAACWPKAGGS